MTFSLRIAGFNIYTRNIFCTRRMKLQIIHSLVPRLNKYLSACLPACLSDWLSVCLSFCLSVLTPDTPFLFWLQVIIGFNSLPSHCEPYVIVKTCFLRVTVRAVLLS